MKQHDHNEAMRLAEWHDEQAHGWWRAAELKAVDRAEPVKSSLLRKATFHKDSAALLRQLAERIAELEAEQAGIIQAITDPENQPSQYGTVTIDMHAEDGFVIERMAQLLAETVLILRGPPPKLTRWSYHDIPERVAALRAERDTLRAELETERMRLVACGVVAMANTAESAAKARDMHPDYLCASVRDVAAAVDREMTLRAEVERMGKAISDFCDGARWAVDVWKNQSYIKPLFDIDTARKEAQ